MYDGDTDSEVCVRSGNSDEPGLEALSEMLNGDEILGFGI